MNIPKIIHYCWFGRGELSPLAKKCIASWRKYLPDYEIREWNENNFDVSEIDYIREAYAAKKYAFVSDYARFKILYEHGGVYFDVDVEVLKPLDDILKRGGFMGLEQDVTAGTNETNCVNPGLGLACAPGLGLACAPGLGLYKELIDLYRTLRFEISPGVYNEKTVVQYMSETLLKRGLRIKSGIMELDGLFIYPTEYFCPKSMITGKTSLTENTYTIHHYTASWFSPAKKVRMYAGRIARRYCPWLVSLIRKESKK